MAAGTAAASPPRWPRVATERINTPASLMWAAIRIWSPSSAPLLNGDGRIDGQHRHRHLVTALTFDQVVRPSRGPGEPLRAAAISSGMVI